MLTGPALGAAIEAARIKKGVSKQALAAAFGVAPPSVQGWVKTGQIEKERLPKLWRYFADVAGPEHWGLQSWSNLQYASEGYAPPVAQELSHPHFYPERLSSAERVPVIGTLRMGELGNFERQSPEGGSTLGTVDGISSSRSAFALRVIGDHLYPTIRHGACLVVEPGAPCVVGELVLLELQDGSLRVLELVAQRDDHISVVSVTGANRQTVTRASVRSVDPIINVVAASKFLPASD